MKGGEYPEEIMKENELEMDRTRLISEVEKIT